MGRPPRGIYLSNVIYINEVSGLSKDYRAVYAGAISEAPRTLGLRCGGNMKRKGIDKLPLAQPSDYA